MAKNLMDLTAKEFWESNQNSRRPSALVTVYGFDFFITVDRLSRKPVIFIDNSNTVVMELDNEKNFNSVRACVEDIKKQLRVIQKELASEIKKEKDNG